MIERLSFEREMEDLGLKELEGIQYEIPLWPPPSNRRSINYIQWIQIVLNRLMGIRLIVDGRMGPNTQNAIKRFQQQQKLAADGIVGPKTEATIKASLSAGLEATVGSPPVMKEDQIWILDRFEFAKANLTIVHKGEIRDISEYIKAQEGTPNQVRYIDIIGHTDPVGATADNYRLGCLRAWAVTKELRQDLSWQLSAKIVFRIASLGESQPVKGDDAASRRVEVSLYNSMPRSFSKDTIRCDLPGKAKDKLPGKAKDKCDCVKKINFDEVFEWYYYDACDPIQKAKIFCAIKPPLPRGGSFPIKLALRILRTATIDDICKLSPDQIEKQVDNYVIAAVYAHVVRECRASTKDCNLDIEKLYFDWKRKNKKRCM